MTDEQVIPLPQGAACLGCRYSLEHLTLPRCPECGRPFTPGDVTTYQCDQRKAMLRRRSENPAAALASSFVFLLVTAGTYYFAGAGFQSSKDYRLLLALIPAAPAGLIAQLYVRKWTEPDRGPKVSALHRRLCRRALIFAIITFALISIDVWTCPHGTGIKLGPWVLTVTGRDGMCRNKVRLGHRYELSERWSFYLTK